LHLTFTLESFSDETFEYFCQSLLTMSQLNRLVCRFEGGIDLATSKSKLEMVLLQMKHSESALIVWKNEFKVSKIKKESINKQGSN